MKVIQQNLIIIFILIGQLTLRMSGLCSNWTLTICHCSERRQLVICSYRKYIPVLPEYVTNLQLKKNTFPHLTKGSFANLSSLHLKRLEFINNKIRTIEKNAFANLKYLTKLEIVNEKSLNIQSLKSSFSSLNKSSLNILKLEQSGWTTIPDDMFEILAGCRLSYLSLEGNKLKTMNSSWFIPFAQIKVLSCAKNNISTFDAKGLQYVEEINLSHNDIIWLPSFCSINSRILSLVPRLKKLSLTGNLINVINTSTFECLDILNYLNLDGIPIRELKNNVFSVLHNLKTLSIGQIKNLKIISQYAFNISSLVTLYFGGIGYRFDRRKSHYDKIRIFKFLPHLQELNLEKNYLPHAERDLYPLLSPLINLRILNLQTTYINEIPEVVTKRMPCLQILNLNGNKINHWNETTFKNFTSLRKLYLDGNDIRIINKTSFPTYLLESLEILALANNHFLCTCEQKWFLNTLRSTNLTKKLLSWPFRYSCYYPERLRFTHLDDYFPTDAECQPLDMAYIVIISVSTSFIVVFLIIIVSFGCQINIRNGLYLLRVYRQIEHGYARLECSDDFEFDAFVVYCEEDSRWVHSDLLEKLENEGLRICVHHRDFKVGEPITSNIEHYMKKSWKIIVVMSNNFARSQWCQWELDMVQERRRRLGKSSLVLIMYQQIDSHHMTSDIRTLLTTTPYLTFTEGVGEHLFWTAVIRDARKSLSFLPTAVVSH